MSASTPEDPSQQALDRAIAGFGKPLIAFALNLAEQQLSVQHIEPDVERLQALHALLAYLDELRRRAFDTGGGLDLVAHGLGRWRENGNWIVDLNRSFGGDELKFDTVDPIAAALQPVVSNVYPYLLSHRHMDSDARWHGPIAIDTTFRVDSDARAFATAILDHDTLGAAFGNSIQHSAGMSEEGIRSVWVQDNFGSGRTLQGAMLPYYLVAAAYQLARIRGSLSFTAIGRSISEVIQILSGALSEDGGTAPVFVGIDGVQLHERSELHLPWGVMRPVPPIDDLIHPYPGIVMPTPRLPEWGNPGGSGGVILELSSRLKYTVEQDAPDPMPKIPEADRRSAQASRELIVQQVDHVALSLLLARLPEFAGTFNVAWSGMLNPLELQGFGGVSASRRGSFHLSEEDFGEVQAWAQRVANSEAREVKIAGRRAVSAAFERHTAEDRLIDAIVGWEALFGKGTELRFRVSAAMARLLEEEPSKRPELRTSLGRLYDLRSKIVHGSQEVAGGDLGLKADEAHRKLVECLRVLLRDRPELLDDENRSETLILE